ncbi:hypothetical protein MHU86_21438 [Fragilaria crotonensis]|nr:hypothetical protein MHU86_21438 [Fragilaria crotonensis]
MTKGMVGWAGGGTGPDFFIDTYDAPATHWGNQHTVWGKVMDGESLAIITRIYDLPATNRGGMTFLDENIKFTMSLDTA